MFSRIRESKLWPHRALLISITLLMILTHFGRIYPDSKKYANITEWFMSRNNSVDTPFLAVYRPLVPLIASILSPITGVFCAISVINSIFWVLSALVFYEWSKIWLGDRETAFYSALFYTTSIPALMVGASALVDMTSWFFIALTLYLVEKSRLDEKLVYCTLTGLTIGVGALSKETVLSLLLYVILVETNEVLSKKRSVKDGVIRILTAACFTAIPPTLWFLQFGENLMVYYRIAVGGALISYKISSEILYPYETIIKASLPNPIKQVLHIMKEFGGTFWITLFFIPSGLNAEKNRGKIKDLLFLLIPLTITIALRSYIERRRAFILFPFIIPLAASGIRKLLAKYKYGEMLEVIMACLYVVTTNIIYIMHPG